MKKETFIHAESTTVSVSAKLEPDLDPLCLYASLSDRGARTDTMLFEAAEGPTLIVASAAARIEARGDRVIVTALNRNGRQLKRRLAARFSERVARDGINKLDLIFTKSASDDCEERLKAPSLFDALRAVTAELHSPSAADPFDLNALGVIAFDHVDMFEDLPGNAEDPLGFPDFLFWVPDSLIVIDHDGAARAICTDFGGASEQAEECGTQANQRLETLVRRCRNAAELERGGAIPLNEPLSIDVDLDDGDFADLVVRLKAHIASGDVYQIVASRTFSAPCANPFAAFRALRQLDPSPYHCFVSGDDFQLFGASPETSLRVFENDGLHVELKPIAGTRPRGATVDEDDRLEAALRLDPKELAEHMMLVDLARNDVARISVSGTRRVSQMMAVERYAQVMHLVSRVTGKLRPSLDAVDALKACLNMGTLTGAPKIRATQLLREAEKPKRGPYGGAIGWLNGDGHLDSAIVIRSALVRDGMAYVRAGAGIVHDSDPAAEADETRRKASAVLSVLGASEI